MAKQLNRSGVTLVEWVIVLVIIVVLLGMLLPAVQSGHTPARRTMCRMNLLQLSLAAMNYESAHMGFPMGVGVKDQNGVLQTQPISGLVSLLRFIEADAMYEDISNPAVIDGVEYPAFGPSLADADYAPWASEIDCLICPSAKPSQSNFGRTSYAFSVGDVARNINQQETLRGAYGYFKSNRITDITDGTSNTIGLIEIGCDKTETTKGGCWLDGKAAWLDDPGQVLSLIKNGSYPASAKTIGRGSHWGDGRAGVGLANTILPPNSPSFQVQGSPTADGVYSAGSMHTGGVHVGFIDGSTHFISEDIDVGASSAPTLTVEQMESPDVYASLHGVWGALGTIGSGEVVDLNF